MIKELENHFTPFRTTIDSGQNYQWILKLTGKVRKGTGYLYKLANNYKGGKTFRVGELWQIPKSTPPIIG